MEAINTVNVPRTQTAYLFDMAMSAPFVNPVALVFSSSSIICKLR